MSSDKNKNDSYHQEGQMEQKEGKVLFVKEDPQTVLDILSHGKKERAEKISLCPICSLLGQERCPFPGGDKTGHCVVFSLGTNTTINQVLSLIRN